MSEWYSEGKTLWAYFLFSIAAQNIWCTKLPIFHRQLAGDGIAVRCCSGGKNLGDIKRDRGSCTSIPAPN